MSEYLFKTDREIMTCQDCPMVKRNRLSTTCPLKEGAERRYGTCPLVEVPTPHGDIKDTKDILNRLALKPTYDALSTLLSVQAAVGESPTIIEASTEEDTNG